MIQKSPADTAHPGPFLPPIGQRAVDVLQDSISALPVQAERWVTVTLGAFARLLPRIGLAVLVVAVILVASHWAHRNAAHKAVPHATRRRTNLGVAGALAAATAAAAILGATKFAAALLTFLVFYVAALLAHVVGERLLSRSQVGPGAIELLLSVLHTTLIAIGLVESLSTVGLNVTGLLAGLGIAGLAVGFAAQDTLANLIAGITLLWDRPLQVGDWVQVGDSPPGRVRHLTLRTTRLETIDVGLLIIPNKDVTGARLFNFSMLEQARVRLSVGIPADADGEAARQILLDVARREKAVAKDPAPAVNFTSISDTAITLELVLTTTDLPSIRLLRAALLEHVVAAFRARGIKPMTANPPTDAGRGPWA